jgi:serine-type D-Ala-D-Ala carboxypeptidase (penicillin-binding protein 5/6)
MQVEKENSIKDFQLPSLVSNKIISSRAMTVEKRKYTYKRISSTSAHQIVGTSISPETKQKTKHNIPPYMSAKTWAVLNTITNQILFGQGTEYRREIASLTKIMTCYLSLKLCESYKIPFQKKVIISSRASRISGTSACLLSGDEISIIDLLHGLMLPSGNDAAYALAEYFGALISSEKPVKGFVDEMNRTCKSLGLHNTKFRNPHGMSIRPNYSTAKDVCYLAHEALKNKIFYEIVNKKDHTCNVYNAENRILTWKSTNKLLGKGVDGVKTGQTPKAGFCLCVRYVSSKTPLIITVLCCKTNNSRWVEVPRLAEWSYSKL